MVLAINHFVAKQILQCHGDRKLSLGSLPFLWTHRDEWEDAQRSRRTGASAHFVGSVDLTSHCPGFVAIPRSGGVWVSKFRPSWTNAACHFWSSQLRRRDVSCPHRGSPAHLVRCHVPDCSGGRNRHWINHRSFPLRRQLLASLSGFEIIYYNNQ